MSEPQADGPDGFNLGRGLLDYRQPAVPAGRVARSRGRLTAYRAMAFITGFVLLAATIVLIIRYTAAPQLETANGILWVAHGWLFLIYVLVTASLGFRLRWPLPRYLLVMLAGTIPTMSFVAEHVVTRAVRRATRTGAQPVSVRD